MVGLSRSDTDDASLYNMFGFEALTKFDASVNDLDAFFIGSDAYVTGINALAGSEIPVTDLDANSFDVDGDLRKNKSKIV